MGMEYKLAVKIMDDVIKGYLKDREYADDEVAQIVEAYNRIRNG